MSKDLGPWEGSPISTRKQAFGNEVCGNGLQWAINKINTASGPSGQPNLIDYYNLPELECIPAFGPGVGSGVGGYDLECLYNTGADFDFDEGLYSIATISNKGQYISNIMEVTGPKSFQIF